MAESTISSDQCENSFTSNINSELLNVKELSSNSKKQKLDQSSKYINDRCIQIIAWLMLSVGLCIIMSTLYVAIRQANTESKYDKYYSEPTVTDITVTTDMDYDSDNNIFDVLEEFQKSVRKSERTPSPIDFQGCQEVDCKIGCVRAPSIYKELGEIIHNVQCRNIDLLLIEQQYFPRGVIKNYWEKGNFSIRELFIRWSNVTHIRTDAFNSPIFLKTFFLLWSNLKLKRVDSGALLGLHSLKYLIIDTKMPSIDRSFFQPVQTTLKFLKLNSGLTIDKHTNIFGVAHMEELEYADLSNNNLNGPLTKKMFYSTPNLRYLIMTNSKITSIDDGAFDSLAGKLQLINLSSNFITILSGDVLELLLKSSPGTFINLSMNNWNCDCLLRSFASTYLTYRNQFLDILYCRAPHGLYGKSIADVNYNHCSEIVRLPPKDSNAYTTDENSPLDYNESYGVTTSNSIDSNGMSETEVDEVFQMRCLTAVTENESNTNPNDEISSMSSSESGDSNEQEDKRFGQSIIKIIKDSVHNKLEKLFKTTERPAVDGHAENMHYFEFEPPEFDFTVDLLANGSAKVIIDNPSIHINVIWFCENNFVASDSIIHSCMGYAQPYLITDILEQNVTYTFCLMPFNAETITPFNCLPLYVPAAKTSEDIWIPSDEKPFTIGMLCLIFALSAFFGAIIAYFGIRNYPDLLEGSKNVLVVKKSDQNDYVPTISETDYIKSTSFKKKAQHASMKSISSKSPLTESCTNPTSLPFCISSKNLERLSSVKSSSTLFEDSFTSFSYISDDYEMPKCIDVEFPDKKCSSNNAFATSPTTPPPLPKRNSSNADSLTSVINRFSD